MSLFRGMITCVMVLLLSACQFHLRGHQHNLGKHYPQLRLASQLPNSPMEHTLLHALKSAGVKLDTQPTSPEITLFEYHESSTPLAYGVEGDVRRERFEGKMTVAFSKADGQTILPRTTFTAIRDQLRYSDYDLATTAETERVRKDLRQDLANQLILKLSFAAPALEQAEPAP